MSDILVSIIVPVYNAESYLRDCIGSVYALTNDKWQLILVNDGSKDNSADICREYSACDSRIIYLEQKNAGVSVARNNGIQHANGEWVTFLDADDMLAPDALKLLDLVTPDLDMFIAKHTKTLKNFTYSLNNQYISGIELQQSILNFCEFKASHGSVDVLNEYNRWSCWGRFYRTKILKENNIVFPKEVKLGEDLLFCLRYSKKIKWVMLNDSTIYYYRQNEGSVTQHFHKDRIRNTILLIENVAEEIMSTDLYHCFCVFVIDRITKCCCDFYTDKRCNLNNQEAAKELRELCNRTVFREAIDKCGYEYLATGKRNRIYNILTLWFLKRRAYYSLLVCLKLLKKGRYRK